MTNTDHDHQAGLKYRSAAAYIRLVLDCARARCLKRTCERLWPQTGNRRALACLLKPKQNGKGDLICILDLGYRAIHKQRFSYSESVFPETFARRVVLNTGKVSDIQIFYKLSSSNCSWKSPSTTTQQYTCNNGIKCYRNI